MGQRRGEIRKEEIIRGALDCFLEKGVVETSIEDIRKVSGASIGSIYHHFGGKENLALETYLTAIRSYESDYRRVLVENPGAREGIAALVENHLNWMEKNPRYTYIIFEMRLDARLFDRKGQRSEIYGSMSRELNNWYQKHQKNGQFRELSIDLVNAYYWGPLLAYSNQWFITKNRKQLFKQSIREIPWIIWYSFRAENPELSAG